MLTLYATTKLHQLESVHNDESIQDMYGTGLHLVRPIRSHKNCTYQFCIICFTAQSSSVICEALRYFRSPFISYAFSTILRDVTNFRREKEGSTLKEDRQEKKVSAFWAGGQYTRQQIDLSQARLKEGLPLKGASCLGVFWLNWLN